MRRRFQRGTLVNRKGVWTGMWYEYRALPDGTQKAVKKAKAYPGLSQRAARAALQPILDSVNNSNGSPIVIPKKEPTLIDAIAEWRRLVAIHLKPRGRETAESHLHAHIIPRLGSVSLSKLDQKAVQQFVADITPSRSGKTVENIVLTLTGIIRHVRKWGWTVAPVSFPDLSMPEKTRPRPRFYEVAELKQIIAASPEPLRTILIVVSLTGMRINEALALKLEDLDFKNRLISVRHSVYNGVLTTPKTRASIADLHMPLPLEQTLQEFLASEHYRKNDAGFLFCNKRMRPFSDNKAREKMLRPVLKKLNLYSPGRLFHAIRHTAGSVMLESGASILNVQQQLRHSSASVTLNVYGHLLDNSQRTAADRLAARMTA